MLVVAGCEATSTGSAAPTWRKDCPSVAHAAPLSLDAARDAQRAEARRHELRIREVAAPGSFLRDMHAALDAKRVAAGDVCLTDLDDLGQLLFEHEYGFADGLGSGLARGFQRSVSPGPCRRVRRPRDHRLSLVPLARGPNGAGAETDNAFLEGDGEHTASGDERNPPALVALGVAQALAAEMSRDLQKQQADLIRDAARVGATREARLTAKGVDFGVLRATAKGTLDASGVRGVDPDLVVKPFGWKGTLPTFADFAAEALQIHMGVQSDKLSRAARARSSAMAATPRTPTATACATSSVLVLSRR
jgi:hypothetical protein